MRERVSGVVSQGMPTPRFAGLGGDAVGVELGRDVRWDGFGGGLGGMLETNGLGRPRSWTLRVASDF
jgi:hypothetical protein